MWGRQHKYGGVRAANDSIMLIGTFLAAGIAAGLTMGFAPQLSSLASLEPNTSPAAQTASPPRASAQPDPVLSGNATTISAAIRSEAESKFEPVVHARKAGIKTCIDSVTAQSRRVIDTNHSALSIWNTRDPDGGLFQSMLALKYDNKNAPNGAAILTAGPDSANHCGSSFVQIYPTALSCSAIQSDLVKSGKTIASLLGLPVIATVDGTRELLLPSAGGGCVIVATNLN